MFVACITNLTYMTVRQLITKLKKMPPDARVFLADHDHDQGETNGPASAVSVLSSEDAAPDENWASHEPHVVVIHVK